MFPYVPILIRSPDCDETFTSCKQTRGGFGNFKKKLKIALAGVTGVAVHSDLDEILHSSPSKQDESHCLHDHPPFPSLLIATSVWTKFVKSMLEGPVLPYISILMKFYTYDEILHASPSKQEESQCLHCHPPFPPLPNGLNLENHASHMGSCRAYLPAHVPQNLVM